MELSFNLLIVQWIVIKMLCLEFKHLIKVFYIKKNTFVGYSCNYVSFFINVSLSMATAVGTTNHNCRNKIRELYSYILSFESLYIINS